MLIRDATWACWLVFLGYWLLTGRKAKAVAQRQSYAAEWAWHGPLLAAGVLLLFAPFPAPDAPLVALNRTGAWVGVGITAMGLAVCLWARRTLGGNWGSAVSVKQGHELIQSGPYGYVRNPIYTGLLTMFVGTALVVNRRAALVALVLAVAACWVKLKQEETVMERQFPEAYTAYRRRVKALIPFVL